MSRKDSIINFESDRGTTMIEYALLAALISLVAVAGVPALGQTTAVTFNTTAQQISVGTGNAGGGGANTCQGGVGC